MPKEEKDLKRLTRERVARTGERYTTARRNLIRRDSGLEQSPDAWLPEGVGSALRSARKNKGWTLDVAARELGVPRLRLDLLERGVTTIDVRTAEVLERVLELPASVRRRLRVAAVELNLNSGPLDVLLAAEGMHLTPAAAPQARTWIDVFAIECHVVFVAEYLAENAAWIRAIALDEAVTLQTKDQLTCGGNAVHLAGKRREHGLATLSRRYPNDTDWMGDAAIVAITCCGSPEATGAVPPR